MYIAFSFSEKRFALMSGNAPGIPSGELFTDRWYIPRYHHIRKEIETASISTSYLHTSSRGAVRSTQQSAPGRRPRATSPISGPTTPTSSPALYLTTQRPAAGCIRDI
ncbi:hypothetical protein VTN96DRAFT_9277 [Rasamsonia emersonii]